MLDLKALGSKGRVPPNIPIMHLLHAILRDLPGFGHFLGPNAPPSTDEAFIPMPCLSQGLGICHRASLRAASIWPCIILFPFSPFLALASSPVLL